MDGKLRRPYGGSCCGGSSGDVRGMVCDGSSSCGGGSGDGGGGSGGGGWEERLTSFQVKEAVLGF